jgi:uncharacterized membrane protein
MQSGGGATMSIMADHTPMNLIAIKSKAGRIESIDLLRGIVMIIMALDHVRDYFHYDAFMYNPTDLLKTNVPLFFTRWITHYCAPVFVFLAGISAYLYGVKKTRKDLSFFLLTRGVWLILAEFFILSFFRTFNPSYTYINLQVIWVIGLSMIFLSGMVYINNRIILIIAILFITTHNLLDAVHVQGNGLIAILWSIMHDVKRFTFGDFTFFIHYPLLPWLGIMALGYYYGSLYVAVYDTVKRKRILFLSGVGFVSLFIFLRFPNLYGDAAEWSLQKGSVYSFPFHFECIQISAFASLYVNNIGARYDFSCLCRKTFESYNWQDRSIWKSANVLLPGPYSSYPYSCCDSCVNYRAPGYDYIK